MITWVRPNICLETFFVQYLRESLCSLRVGVVPGDVPVHLTLLTGPVVTVGAGVRATGPSVHVVHVLLEAALGDGGEVADGADGEGRGAGPVHCGQVRGQDLLGEGRVSWEAGHAFPRPTFC